MPRIFLIILLLGTVCYHPLAALAVTENPYQNNTPYYTPVPTTTTVPDDGGRAERDLFDTVTTTDESDIFYLNPLGRVLRLGDVNPITIIARLINIALSLVAVILVVLIVLGGFQWLLSFGNEDRVAGAKKTIVNALIGVVLVLISYSLARFVLEAVARATGFDG